MTPYVLGASVSIAGTLCWNALRTDNPAAIPWCDVWRRAAFGVACSFFAWLLLTIVICVGIEHVDAVGRWRLSLLGRIVVGAAIGLAIPQLRLAQRIVRRSWYRYKLSALLASVLVWFSETTRIYPDKIIAREERKLADHVLESGETFLKALDRLYEFHVVGIVRYASLRCAPMRRGQARRLSLVRNRAVKMKYLLRYLGAMACLEALRVTEQEPDAILPSWPAKTGDRRHSGNRRASTRNPPVEHRSMPHGRRKMDSPTSSRVLLLGQ